jgi:hypothetical protein
MISHHPLTVKVSGTEFLKCQRRVDSDNTVAKTATVTLGDDVQTGHCEREYQFTFSIAGPAIPISPRLMDCYGNST